MLAQLGAAAAGSFSASPSSSSGEADEESSVSSSSDAEIAALRRRMSLDNIHDSGDDSSDSFGIVEPKRTVGMRQLIFLSFFCVSGGSFGLEPLVRAGGPLLALVGLLVIPLVWALPTALMTSELASAMPHNGGRVVWAQRAFGPFWALQCGYWTVINNIVDNGLYPVMFVGYLRFLIGEQSYVMRLAYMYMMTVVVTVLNILGVELVGNLSTLFTIIVLSPFVFMGFWGLGELDSSVLVSLPDEGVKWGTYLTVLMWNTSGWDSIGAIAGEVKLRNPKTFPRAMIVTMVIVTIQYVWPMAVAVCILPPNSTDWVVGTYARVAHKMLGPGLEYYLTVCGLVSGFGLFLVLLLMGARTIFSLAPPDLLDIPFLARLHPRFGTPVISILINSVGVCFVVLLPFEAIVEIDVVLYGILLVVEFSSLVRLRITEPRMERPYMVPIHGWPLAVLFSGPPCLLVLVSLFFLKPFTLVLSSVVVLIGMIGGIFIHRRRFPGAGDPISNGCRRCWAVLRKKCFR